DHPVHHAGFELRRAADRDARHRPDMIGADEFGRRIRVEPPGAVHGSGGDSHEYAAALRPQPCRLRAQQRGGRYPSSDVDVAVEVDEVAGESMSRDDAGCECRTSRERFVEVDHAPSMPGAPTLRTPRRGPVVDNPTSSPGRSPATKEVRGGC